MSDWLDTFSMMGVSLNEGEKSLMRFAMNKEQERIIKLLENYVGLTGMFGLERDDLIALIKGEQK